MVKQPVTAPVAETVRRIASALTRVSRTANVVAACLVGLMIGLGVWDVASRELDVPYISAGTELAALLLAGAAFLAWPGVEADHAHVTSTVLVDRLPARVSRWVILVGHAVSAVVVAWLAWASYGRAGEARGIGETTVGSDPLVVWPARYLLAIALTLLLLQMLVSIGRMFTESPAGDPDDARFGDGL